MMCSLLTGVEGTDRLDRSTQRLKASQALANETEAIGASTLAQLQQQRETIDHTTRVLYESEGYVDRSIKSLRGIARRYDILWGPGSWESDCLLTWPQNGYESGYNHCHHYGLGSSHHRGYFQQVQMIHVWVAGCLFLSSDLGEMG
jgi:hypothetical protein